MRMRSLRCSLPPDRDRVSHYADHIFEGGDESPVAERAGGAGASEGEHQEAQAEDAAVLYEDGAVYEDAAAHKLNETAETKVTASANLAATTNFADTFPSASLMEGRHEAVVPRLVASLEDDLEEVRFLS